MQAIETGRDPSFPITLMYQYLKSGSGAHKNLELGRLALKQANSLEAG